MGVATYQWIARLISGLPRSKGSWPLTRHLSKIKTPDGVLVVESSLTDDGAIMTRWRRFGIKAILILVALVSLPLPWLVQERQRRADCREVLNQIALLGGVATTNQSTGSLAENLLGQNISHLTITTGRQSERLCLTHEQLEKLHGIKTLVLLGRHDDWSQFHRLPELEELFMNGHESEEFFSNKENIEQLKRFDGLKVLSLSFVDVLTRRLSEDDSRILQLQENLPGTQICVRGYGK